MPDILIRGMEMPTVCGICPIEQFNEGFSWEMYCCPLIKDGYTTDIREVERRDDCPLVELPPHGRLIDADDLAAKCDDPYWCVWLSDIDDAQSIIPADKEETNEQSN